MTKENSKKAWYKKWWGIIIIVFGVFFIIGVISGISGNKNNANNPNNTIVQSNDPTITEPIYLSEFNFALEKELVRFYFQIKDISGAIITPAGKLNYNIICKSDKNIPTYTKTIMVKSTDYVTYQNTFTGVEQGKYYEFYIPIVDLKSCPVTADATQSVIAAAYGVDASEHNIAIKFYNIDSNIGFSISNS